MEKIKQYSALIDNLIEDYSGAMKNEKIWALGAETPEASELHALNVCRLDKQCARLEAIKSYIEESILPENDIQSVEQKFANLIYYISEIMLSEKRANNVANHTRLSNLLELVINSTYDALGD